jgi:hypothetical protein
VSSERKRKTTNSKTNAVGAMGLALVARLAVEGSSLRI